MHSSSTPHEIPRVSISIIFQLFIGYISSKIAAKIKFLVQPILSFSTSVSLTQKVPEINKLIINHKNVSLFSKHSAFLTIFQKFCCANGNSYFILELTRHLPYSRKLAALVMKMNCQFIMYNSASVVL